MAYPNYYPPAGNMYIRRARDDGDYQDYGGNKGPANPVYPSFGPQIMFNPFLGAPPMNFAPPGYLPTPIYPPFNNINNENIEAFTNPLENEQADLASVNKLSASSTSGKYSQKGLSANNPPFKYEGSGSSAKKFNDSGFKRQAAGGESAEKEEASNNINNEYNHSSNGRRGNFRKKYHLFNLILSILF